MSFSCFRFPRPMAVRGGRQGTSEFLLNRHSRPTRPAGSWVTAIADNLPAESDARMTVPVWNLSQRSRWVEGQWWVGYGRPREGAPGQFETFDVPMKIVDNRDQAAGVRSERRPARTATSQCATRHGRYRAVESLVSSLPSSRGHSRLCVLVRRRVVGSGSGAC